MKLDPGRMGFTRRQTASNECGRYISYSFNYMGQGWPSTDPSLINMGNYPAKVSKVVKAKNYHQESLDDSSFGF